jgi:hypothetical protein
MLVTLTILIGVVGVIACFGGYKVWIEDRRLRRAEFIRRYRWPPGLLDKLATHHEGFTRKETALVSAGLRQFFLAYLNSGRREVAMPSQVADDLWHEFILYTRDYGRFCDRPSGASCTTRPRSLCVRARPATILRCAASGGSAAWTKTSTRSGRRGCLCSSPSIPSSGFPTASSMYRIARSCAAMAIAAPNALAIFDHRVPAAVEVAVAAAGAVTAAAPTAAEVMVGAAVAVAAIE